MTKKILILPGDGIGQEVTASAKEVLDFLIAEHNLDFSIKQRSLKNGKARRCLTSLTRLCQASVSDSKH